MESSKLFFQALIAKSGKHLFGFHSPSTYYQVPNNQGGRNEQGVGKIPKCDKSCRYVAVPASRRTSRAGARQQLLDDRG